MHIHVYIQYINTYVICLSVHLYIGPVFDKEVYVHVYIGHIVVNNGVECHVLVSIL